MDKLINAFTEKSCKASVPDIRTGYQVRVYQKIKEGNKERVQMFQGIVIRVNSGSGASKSFTVRKISDGVGVEKVFPIHSPNLVKITVLRAHKVRRSKLHFLRDLSGKALRLKEVPLKLRELKIEKGKEVKIDKKLEKEIELAEKEAEKESTTPLASSEGEKTDKKE